MNKIDAIIEFIKSEAKRFGADDSDELVKSFIFRNNTGSDALKNGGAYFGFISPEEENSGPYHDFSLVVFPDSEDKPWMVTLILGSLGFRNDYELGNMPGVRRLFSKIIDNDGFSKTSYLDMETSLPKEYQARVPYLKKTLKTYNKYIVAAEILNNAESDGGKKKISAFVAAYARLRDWPNNNSQRTEIRKTIDDITVESIDDEKAILDLVKQRRFAILEGAPGTGKTRMAKIIANKLDATIFFTQFHAETSYSDFIYGIKPRLAYDELGYEENKGIFITSLNEAIKSNKNVVLIIDEINRANLSNILGPIFYLFEYKLDDNLVEIDVGGGFKVDRIPPNFYVIGTMNTADRSLAVVDFALRRRFAWYMMKPKIIALEGSKKFYKDDFLAFSDIFNWYASSNELSLQPGQAYFIADSDEEMNNRIKYELLPLIKEYLAEGIMMKAKEEFGNYFYNRIGEILNE